MIYIIFSSIFAGFILGFLVRVFLGRLSLLDLEKNLKKVRVESQLEIENERRQIIANAKSQMLKEKNQQDRDIRDRKNEIVNLEKDYYKEKKL